MAASSNRDLWQVVTGHSALRDHAQIEKELRDSLSRLREGVAYYRTPSAAAEKKVKDGGKVKGNKLTLILEISSHLQLDQEQALELFEGFLIDAHRGTLGELKERVRSEGGRREVVEEVSSYYHSERLHLLRCLKHMLGFWQDPNHPLRAVYSVCIGELTKDEKTFINSLWEQYQTAVEAELPSNLSPSEERQWSVQRLVEQVELLEAILLYYKDFVHQPAELVSHARQLWENGCGLRQSCPAPLVDGAEILQRHIGHLCSLIMVESLDLESILANLDDSGSLDDHHLLKSDSRSSVKQLDDLFSKWGDQDCHTPVLLSWALLNFANQPSSADLEDVRLLGNRALSGGVFQYIHGLLDSPFFSRERPVAGACRSVLHTLLSLALSQFSEDSLGDQQELVAIASLTLTHPPPRLQFWEQGLTVGVGLLLSSSLDHFPSTSSSLSSLLLPLAGDQVSAGHVWQLLSSLSRFTERLPRREIGHQVKVVTRGEEEAPVLMVMKPRSFYTSEARWLGLHGVVLGEGVCGEMWEGWEGEELVLWPLPPTVSGWDLLALEIVRLLQTSPLDSSTDGLVARVTATVQLVTQMVKSDWSLSTELYRITSQTLSMLQRFSCLPHPPCSLLASCVSCLAIMATTNTAETWTSLGQTGFLPYLSSSLPPSHDNLDCLSVAPGHYGQLLKMAECPEGSYPISMAMLDLLATTCLPGNSVVLREQLATALYVMREVFLSCHKWKFKVRSDRHQLELALLNFCHDTLQRHRDSPYSLGVVVATQLLSCPGERGILPLLSLPVSTLSSLHSAALGASSVSPAVESVRLSLSILDLLLHAPPTQQSSLLEWNLANTYPHIVSNIASYIYHHGDPRIPIAATALLTQLCQTTPLSVFSCLGSDAVVKRDVFVSRLSSRVEEEELKRGILVLLTEAVSSQPALAELFLCVQSSSSQGLVKYSLQESSCLHAVMKIVSSSSSPLLPPSLHLLRSLWHGRHDAVLHALRGIPSFWKHVTTPLSDPPSLSSNTHTELTNQMMAACHMMHIIAMEMYYVIQDKLDDGLQSILKDFVSDDGVKKWNKSLMYPEDVSQPLTSVLQAQHKLAVGWKTLLMVASSNHPTLFGFPAPSSLPSPSPPPPPTPIVTDILHAIESHLAAPVSMPTVAMASELSLLMMVLIRRWKNSLPGSEVGDLIGQLSHMMPHVMRLDAAQASSISLQLYTSASFLLLSAHSNRVSVETRFLLGLIPFLTHTLRCIHDNSKGPSHRPDIQAMCLLSEMVGGVSDWSPWLLAFRNESLIPLLIQLVDERLKLQSDEPLIEAILGVFVAMAASQPAAEVLLLGGLLQVLSLPLAGCLDNKLNPAPLTSQLPGTPVLKPHPPTTWSSVWQLSLRVAGLMCHSLSHLSLSPLLDLVGTHQLRISRALDVMEAINSLSSLETTASCLFFLSQLFRHRRQLCFSLPSFHNSTLSSTLSLLAAVATILSRRATLKHIVKTMHAAGRLPSNCCPPPSGRGRGQGVKEESWAAGSGLHTALSQLQAGLLSTLLSCLNIVQHFSPSLSDIVMATTQLDRDEYPCLFLPTLTPPTVDQTTHPTLGALTTCLSIGLDLLKKVDPHQRGSGTPKSKSPAKTPSKSPSKSPRPLTPAELQRQREVVRVMERAAVLCLGQALCALASHTHSPHDLQLMCKELANELSTFCHSLLLTLNRRSSSASSQTPPTSFQEAWSGKSGVVFADTREQVVFRVTDSFIRQLLSLH